MRIFNLDSRLSAIAEKIPKGSRLWDVGSDHAKLPCCLLSNDMITYAVASDIGEMPLASARRNAEMFGLTDRMELKLCDGLPTDAENAADVFVIAGMGGGTIAGILERAGWCEKQGKKFILQPMSSPEDLRVLLYSKNYTVTSESLVRDKSRCYLIIEAEGGGKPESYDCADLIAGKFIDDPEYLSRQIVRLKNQLNGGSDSEKEALVQAIERLKKRIDEKNFQVNCTY